MIIVHIESGLGNQMLSYCEYIALKKINPEQKCYVETITYDITGPNEMICQWNGYELSRIFGIEAPNILDAMTDTEKDIFYKSIESSEFWLHKWNWPVYMTQAFSEAGLSVKNIRGDFEKDSSFMKGMDLPLPESIKQTGWYANIRRFYRYRSNPASWDDKNSLFFKTNENVLTGQRLNFKLSGNDIEKIDTDIKRAFTFPNITDQRNCACVQIIKNCNSVAIHARRGDMLTVNGRYYKSGYFRRAVKYIKKNVDSPVFFFFCDPGSIEWCKENSRTFGLDYNRDKVFFVDWNTGEESFRDMQLMAMCKHNIITNSSFGWWGAYLNQNPNKITISPEIEINTTYHC